MLCVVFYNYLSLLRFSRRNALSHCASIILSVWDHDTGKADDLIGACVLSIKELLQVFHAILRNVIRVNSGNIFSLVF